VAVEATRGAWASRAETAIKTLRDIDGASIQTDGDEVREVHVLTRSTRHAKQIVRDVQTLLLTKFNRSIDHRVVSVAYVDAESGIAAPATERAGTARIRELPPAPVSPPVPATAEDRIRFEGVNLFVSGPRVQAQVELKWKGALHTGTASGVSTRDGAHGLIAAATVAALQEYLEDDLALGVEHAEITRVGGQPVAMVSLGLLSHRQCKVLVGCCTVEQDAQQAVALATLSALNRVVGGLKTKEPTEYVLRPTST
jgi:hypothetical protein